MRPGDRVQESRVYCADDPVSPGLHVGYREAKIPALLTLGFLWGAA
jgi:hypothetical protein